MFNALGMKVNIETKVRDESIKYEIFSKNLNIIRTGKESTSFS
jgi:hypothetical protein